MKTPAQFFDRWRHGPRTHAGRNGSSRATRAIAFVVGVAACASIAGVALQQAGGTLQSSGRTSEGFAALPETANPHPDPNRVFEDSLKQQEFLKRMRELNELRQKEMTTDTEKLVALTHDLKSEVDKGSEGALYVDEMRKVEEIQKLAHGVQVKMRTSVSN